MKTVGVRELRQDASRYLREVQRGETVEVTDRGRPVARLVPVPGEQGIDGLVASGRAVAAAGDLLDLGAPLDPVGGVPSPGEEIARAREDER